jgi:hypothetical protein
MLSRLKMDINEALQQYKIVGDEVFAHPRPPIVSMVGLFRPRYNHENLEKALRKIIKHGSEKETRRTRRPPDKIKMVNENPDACHT